MTLVRDASVRARELGAALKAARSKVGFHGNEIAERLGWSTSKVSRMETGDRACGKLDVGPAGRDVSAGAHVTRHRRAE